MRCSCPRCGTYMIQAESLRLGCVCPECGVHCSDCLGTNTVISREAFQQLKQDPVFAMQYEQDMTIQPAEEDIPVESPADDTEKLRGD